MLRAQSGSGGLNPVTLGSQALLGGGPEGPGYGRALQNPASTVSMNPHMEPPAPVAENPWGDTRAPCTLQDK